MTRPVSSSPLCLFQPRCLRSAFHKQDGRYYPAVIDTISADGQLAHVIFEGYAEEGAQVRGLHRSEWTCYSHSILAASAPELGTPATGSPLS